MRITFAVLALLASCAICHGKEVRWSNFAEDADLKYYLDKKSVISLPGNVYIFWVKSVAKDRDYLKREYNLNDLSYIFTSYELDCDVSSYRIRGTIMFDKNRRELNKTVPAGEAVFEPVAPESMLELAQDEICVREQGRAKTPGTEEPPTVSPEPPAAPLAPAAPVEPIEPPSMQ